jgi:hypothetical protein
MGVLIAARNEQGFVFDFAAHDAFIRAEDADARIARNEDPFVPNPAYVMGAGIEMGHGSLDDLMAELSLDETACEFAPEVILRLTSSYLASPAFSKAHPWFVAKAEELHAMAKEGIARGATTISIIADEDQ